MLGDLVAIDSPRLRAQQHWDALRGTGFNVTVVRGSFRGRLPRVGVWAQQQWRDIRWKVINLRPPVSDITQGLTILDLETARELIRSGYAFPFGHPMPGHVYVRHPVERSRFLCFAQFHEQILTEKATEGARLLLAAWSPGHHGRVGHLQREEGQGRSGGGAAGVGADRGVGGFLSWKGREIRDRGPWGARRPTSHPG